MKKKRPIPTGYNSLDDLESRINQFISINNIALENLESNQERDTVGGQQTAFYSVLSLIKQIRKGGSTWRGGYLDNIGVVMTDYVQEVIDAHQTELELDEQLTERISNDYS